MIKIILNPDEYQKNEILELGETQIELNTEDVYSKIREYGEINPLTVATYLDDKDCVSISELEHSL